MAPLKRAEPSQTLTLELRVLGEAAVNFLELVQTANMLDESFPREESLTIAISLSKLQFGTAEGCRAPLEYARARLPAIRRLHFRMDADPDTALGEVEDYRPMRGLALDQALTSLISATTTALDEYRHLANSHFDDEISEAEFDAVVSSGDKLAAMAVSVRLDEEVAKNILDAPSVPPDAASKRDSLIRTLNDVSNINGLARAEISFRTVVVRWLKLLGNELKDYPNLIRKIGVLISTAVEASQPLRTQWKRYNDQIEDITINELKETSSTFNEIADILEKKREIKKVAKSISSETDFRRWLKTFIEDRQEGPFGIPLADVAIGIQLLLKRKPNELARESGAKNLTAYIRSMNDFTVVSGVRTTRVAVQPYEALHRQLVANEQAMLEFIQDSISSTGSASRRRIENEMISRFQPDQLLFTSKVSTLKQLVENSPIYLDHGRFHEVIGFWDYASEDDSSK